jgi:dynactin 1
VSTPTLRSPHIDVEEEDDVFSGENSRNNTIGDDDPNGAAQIDAGATLSPTFSTASRKFSLSRSPGMTNGLEFKAASLKESEQMKAKIRSLERKILEQKEQVKAADALHAEKEKLETVLQALQNKLRITIQAKAELQTRCDDAEAIATKLDSRDGEHESELEMATLDKEMAEERANIIADELEALKAKHEELELEVDVLREENKELNSVLSPEDKANAGWLQMERDRDRLKEALGILRDMTQQKEIDLNAQIKELQQDLAEAESMAVKYQETAERLAKSDAANRHLMEQLEAVDSNEDLNMALEAEREHKQNVIDQLREQLQTLQEEAQVSDELEAYHIATEKELQQELDEHSAMLNEKDHSVGEQVKIIEDLEYTLSKFRDVVQGLQNEIDDLRRSRDITESEAHEMSSKSRAIMDLNLQLQNSAAKMQLKTIDIELGRMRSEESLEHLSIIQMFVPDSYEAERTPVLTYLCLRRIRSKAALVTTLLRDRIKDRPHLVQDDPFPVFEAIERLCWVSSCCDRFLQYMSSCDPNELANFHNALYELEPVERTVSTWVESLKRDELSKDGGEMLSRMRGVLSHLLEKCILESTETAASELSAHAAMIESYCDSAGGEFNMLSRLVQSKVGHVSSEDQQAIHFDRKMDQFITKLRTIKYVAGKAFQALEELRVGSMCIAEPSWMIFTDAEESAQSLSQTLRDMGSSVSRLFADEENVATWTYSTILERMLAEIDPSQPLQDRQDRNEDVFGLLTAKVQSLQSTVEELASKALDVGTATEFEKKPSPWVVRAKEIKAQKIISHDVQDQLRRLKTQVENQAVTLRDNDRQLEERQIKIDLLESRTKEIKQNSDSILKLKTEADTLRAAKEAAERGLQQSIQEKQAMTESRQVELAELEALKKAHVSGGNVALLGTLGAHDETLLLQLRSEVRFLNTEILSLQAAVRYLKMENYRLKIPPATASTKAASYQWLDAPLRTQTDCHEDAQQLRSESEDVFSGLLDLAKMTKPLALKLPDAKSKTSWRAAKDTPRYQALWQREELEKWHEWKYDLLRRAKVLDHEPRSRTSDVGRRVRRREPKVQAVAIEIVGSPPRQ